MNTDVVLFTSSKTVQEELKGFNIIDFKYFHNYLEGLLLGGTSFPRLYAFDYSSAPKRYVSPMTGYAPLGSKKYAGPFSEVVELHMFFYDAGLELPPTYMFNCNSIGREYFQNLFLQRIGEYFDPRYGSIPKIYLNPLTEFKEKSFNYFLRKSRNSKEINQERIEKLLKNGKQEIPFNSCCF